MQLSGSRVLLTGATGGIGRALALDLAAAGAHVIVSGRRESELRALAEEIGGEALVADLADRDAVTGLVARAGEVDVLVANAALPAAGDLLDFTVAEIDRALEVNLRAPIVTAQLLAGPMIARGRGHLAFISSLSGMVTTPKASMYNATKFGLRGFALALRQDLEGTGVGVSLIAPGFIRDAGMFADSGATPPPGVGTKTPAEVAAATRKAIEGDRGEVMVAPLALKVSALLGGASPRLSARILKLSGGGRTTDALAAGSRHKR